MRLHYLQHVPFEDPAYIKEWAEQQKFTARRTLPIKNETLPQVDDFDWLVILGGPMSVYEEDKYPWLVAEKKLVEQAIAADKIVLGICLGAQMISEVLGGKVERCQHREIGWFPVTLTAEGKKHALFKGVPETFVCMHWHADCFSIPKGATRLAYTSASQNQAFIFGSRVLGLQFHLEFTEQTVARLVKNCSDQLIKAPFIQDAKTILDSKDVTGANRLLECILTNIIGTLPSS